MGILPSKLGIQVKFTATDLLMESLTNRARTNVGGHGNSIRKIAIIYLIKNRSLTNDRHFDRTTIITRF